LHSVSHLLLQPDDIWPAELEPAQKTLWNARLFPILTSTETSESILWLQYDVSPSVQTICNWRSSTRVSLQDILSLSDSEAEFHWRTRASFLVDMKQMESILLERKNESLLPIFQRCTVAQKHELLHSLDEVAASAPLDICARTLCTISDILASLPGASAYPRAGPALNPQFKDALTQLSHSKTPAQQNEALKLLTTIRTSWLAVGDAQLYMRAARHYDAAWSSLTRRGVETVAFSYTSNIPTPVETW
jgi:hypothetical protein